MVQDLAGDICLLYFEKEKPLKAKYSGGHGNLPSLQVLLHVSSSQFERKHLKNLRKAIKY